MTTGWQTATFRDAPSRTGRRWIGLFFVATAVTCAADAWFAAHFLRRANAAIDTEQTVLSGEALWFGAPFALAVVLTLAAALYYRLAPRCVTVKLIVSALAVALLPLLGQAALSAYLN